MDAAVFFLVAMAADVLLAARGFELKGGVEGTLMWSNDPLCGEGEHKGQEEKEGCCSEIQLGFALTLVPNVISRSS